MKTYLDCYPCFLRQALSASRRAGASADQQRRILLWTMEHLAALPAEATPPEMAEAIHERFAQAGLIIAKGQANYETLSGSPAPVFFLLQAKCGVIADELGVQQGAIVLEAPTPRS